MNDPGSILLEEARVLRHEAHPGSQFILELHAPRIAARAQPGQFVHLRCAPGLPMRRPLSLLGADAASGQLSLLYKVVGEGTRLLAQRQQGEALSLMGPIGQPFAPPSADSDCLFIGGGVGIPPMLYLAQSLARAGRDLRGSLLLMGSEAPAPFSLSAARTSAPGIAVEVNLTLPDIEALGLPARLASLQARPGWHRGYVTELASDWLVARPTRAVQLYACGPEPMLRACAQLAARLGLTAQLSLEEHMACAVGGCAGCTVRIMTPQGPAMKRVCVDGPVFEAAAVYPEFFAAAA
jgi:dihydroorotate dehydrogenase electron transfer subunit